MEEKVTIAKIARECGTSIGTVDRALNNRSGINPHTRDMVLSTAERLGYKTNKLAGALGRKKLMRIAVIYPNAPVDFYSCIDKGIRKAGQEISDFGVQLNVFRYGVDGAEDELRLLESIDCSKFDAIALDPLNAASAEYVEKFTAAGKPVALFNNDLPGSSRLFFVGSDPLQVGSIGADVLGFLMCGKGSAAVLGNFTHSMPFVGRFDGFCNAMYRLYPDIVIRSCADCRHDGDITEKNIENFLSTADGTKGIFCTSYSSTMGAINALRRLERKDVYILGFDVSNTITKAIKDGVCQAVLYQDPYKQAFQTIQLLSRHILEGWKPREKQIFIETSIVFRQNVDNYTDGISRWDLSI